MKKILICVIAVVSLTFAANDELLETLADETLHNLLYCNPKTGKIDENCKKQKKLLSEREKKIECARSEKTSGSPDAEIYRNGEKTKIA